MLRSLVPLSLMLATFLGAAPAAHAVVQDDCSLDEVDWRQEAPSGHPLASVDTGRLDCEPGVYRDAVLRLATLYLEPACPQAEAGLPGAWASMGSQGAQELNWQAEGGQPLGLFDSGPSWGPGEGHLYVQDSRCGYEGLVLLAANGATGTAVLSIGNEQGDPDGLVSTSMAFVTDWFAGIGEADVSVPSCGSSAIEDPVDPAWTSSSFSPSPSAAGSPWAVAPYGLAPWANEEGNCAPSSWQVTMDVQGPIADVVAVPLGTDGVILGYVERRVLEAPGGVRIAFMCATIEGPAPNACALIGEPDGVVLAIVIASAPVLEPQAVKLCEARVTAMAIGFGLDGMPTMTPCLA